MVFFEKPFVKFERLLLSCLRDVPAGPFEELYVQPAAGDAGGALGAALWVHHGLLGKPREFVMEHAAWGPGFETAGRVGAPRPRPPQHPSPIPAGPR